MDLQDKIAFIENKLLYDPLFEVLKKNQLEDELYKANFFEEIDVTKYYGTIPIAAWFGISDSKLRYYITPFYNYLFDEDAPNNDTAYRLGFVSIVKLGMMLMLKDEYKTKGLQRLIGGQRVINGENNIIPPSFDFKEFKELENQLNKTTELFKQLGEKGLYSIEQGQGPNEFRISLNKNLSEIFNDPQNKLQKREELLRKKDTIAMNLKIEYLRLDHTESRLADLKRYLEVMKLKFNQVKNNSFFSKLFKTNNTSDVNTTFNENAEKDIEFLRKKIEIVKETIRTKEKELAVVQNDIESVNTWIETNTKQIEIN